MNNIFIILISIIGGCWLILYGITRTEKNFNIYKNTIRKNVKITNKKAYILTNKIHLLIAGFLIIILGFLINYGVIYDKGIDLYFLSIFIFQFIMKLFIEFKYFKKLSKVKGI